MYIITNLTGQPVTNGKKILKGHDKLETKDKKVAESFDCIPNIKVTKK